MIKIPLILLSLLFAACQSKIKMSDEQKEIHRLNLKILEYEQKLNQIKNAIVIPFDSISEYIMPSTFYQNEVKINEEHEFTTLLGWRKFPSNIKVEWKKTNGVGKLLKFDYDGLHRYVKVKYNKIGEYEEYGMYKLTFPNGKIIDNFWTATIKVVKD
jgi:hypothetical protein